MGGTDRKRSEPKSRKPGMGRALLSGLREMAFPLRAFKPRTVVGIDIGSGAVKAVKLARGSGRWRVVRWSIRESNPARRESDRMSLRQAVEGALAEVGGPGDHLALGLSGPEARIHQFHLPEITGKELGRAVEWQVQKDLGGEGADLCVGFAALGRARSGSEKSLQVLAASVPRASLTGLLDALAPLAVHSIGVIPLAYGSLLPMVSDGRKGGHAIVDVGGDGTWISILRRGALVYARRIGVAGGLFTQSLTQPVQTPEGPLRYSTEEAEAVKREKVLDLNDPAGHGNAPDYFSVLLRPAVERLSAEVERTLVHFVNANSGDPIERVYLTGGGSLLRGLAEAMSARLAMPVEPLDLSRIPGADSPGWEPMGDRAARMAGAVGTALGWAGGINLLPGTRRTTRSTALARATSFWGAAALVAAIPFATGVTEVATDRVDRELAEARTRLSAVEPEQEQRTEIAETRARLAARQDLVSLLPAGESIAPQILKALPERLPEGVVVNTLRLDHGALDVESECGSPGRQILLSGEVHGSAEGLEATLLDFLLEIRSSPFYDAPVVTRKKRIFRDKDSALEFEIVCALK